MPQNAARIVAPQAAAAAAPDGATRRGAGTGERRTVNVLGHYRLIRKLGEGAMGTVYQAEDVTDGRIVAVKVLKKEMAGRPTAVSRFDREAQMMAHIDHPNVLRSYEVGSIHWCHYLVIEYVAGGSVEEHLKRRGRFGVGDALHVILACARGLHHAHEHGMIHRDVKPANILLTSDGTVKLADLGLAKLAESDEDLTRTGTAAGTPLFMAPEQVIDAKHVDCRSDIYGLGCVLYALLAGRPPFEADSILAILEAKQKGKYLSLPEHCIEAPQALCAIMDRMLASKPEDRYGSCAEAIVDIEALNLAADRLSFMGAAEPLAATRPMQEAIVQETVGNEPPRPTKKQRRIRPTRTAKKQESPHARVRRRAILAVVVLSVLLAGSLFAVVGLLASYLMARG
jgi:eukaryotic-like serine/threonine-protein kinase